MSVKVTLRMAAGLLTFAVFSLTLSGSAGAAAVAVADPDDVDVDTFETLGRTTTASSLPFLPLLSKGDPSRSCETCRRYLGFVTCTQYQMGIPRVYLRGDKDCQRYHERKERA